MKGIVGFAIDNWRMTIGIMLFAVMGGLIALSRIPVDAEPDIPVPFINISVVLPGVSPEDSQRLLIRPLEAELKSVDGIVTMDGIAATSVGNMILEFSPSFDQETALSDVLEKVDRARAEFPSEAQEPLVEELNTSSFPIFVVNLYGPAPERELQSRAKQIKRQLEGIPEILEAKITGERLDVLEAELDPGLVESLGVTFNEIAAAISRNNSLVTAGNLETESGKFGVKLPGLIENQKDLADLVIRTNANGSIIRMKDISNVRRGYKDATSYARFNGQPSVSIEITKRSGENIISTIDKTRERVQEIIAQPDWPETVNVAFSQDKSETIREMVTSLFSSIINAVILVFIVCIAALGLRSALFIGWAIPASFLIAIFFLFVQGISMNMMIMYGMILSVGVLVDSAIVIVEYADRKLAEGLSRKEAFKIAGERMFWPIISSTATTLAAFIPLLFWNTIPGQFMSFMPLTMIYVLSASLVMALIFLPTLGTLIGPKTFNKPSETLKALSGQEGNPLSIKGATGIYIKTINLLIKRPIAVVLGTILLCFSTVIVFTSSMQGPPAKPVEFFIQEPTDQLFILAQSRGNTNPRKDLEIALTIEDRIKDVNDIKAVYTVTGGTSGDGPSFDGPTDVPSDTVVTTYIELTPFNQRKSRVLDVMEDLRVAIADMPGIRTEIKAISQGPPVGKDIEVQISSDDVITAQKAAKMVRRRMETVEGLFQVDDTLPLPGVEWELQIDREEAGRLGLDVSTIGASLQFATEGALVAEYRPSDADEEVDIRIRYPKSKRDLSLLDTMRVLTPNGAVPLSSVVKRTAKTRQDKITRRDQQIVYIVKANSQDGYATNIQVDELREWLVEEANLPDGVSFKFLGQSEENSEATAFGQAAFVAILFMMSVILLLQFNSFYHVFLTLSAVITSIFGVLLALALYPYVSIILTMTGLIALMGIVVNNNIVLIDTYQRLLENGYDSEDAALRTAAQRLRPVLLTTATTVVGLMPLVLAWQADIFSGQFTTRGTSTSAIWAPISYVLVTGLTFATVLTLLVTPVLLAAPTVLARRLKSVGEKFKSETPQGPRTTES